jgi:hypothetical protein
MPGGGGGCSVGGSVQEGIRATRVGAITEVLQGVVVSLGDGKYVFQEA